MAEDGKDGEGPGYLGMQDSGLVALCTMAAYHHCAASPDHVADELALTAPASEGDLLRAARLLNLKTRVMTTRYLARCPLPAIVCLADGRYRIISARAGIGDYLLIDPLSMEVQSVTADGLLTSSLVRLIAVQPRRAEASGKPLSRSGLLGFRAILWRYRVVLGHVIIISLLVPAFALATSLFSLEVLDRMLAHHRYEALVVLVLGLVGLKVRG